MTARLVYVMRPGALAAGVVALAGVAGCSGAPTVRTVPRPAGPSQRTIVLGASEIVPPDLRMRRDDTLAFVNTAEEPLRLEFVQPGAGQAGRITCRPDGAATAGGAEARWETFRTNDDGHMVADIPPGEFRSRCTLAPGSYAYEVSVVGEQVRPPGAASGTPARGTVTVE